MEPVHVHVPLGAEPGVTRLEVALHGRCLQLVVPAQAEPGDQLRLEKLEGDKLECSVVKRCQKTDSDAEPSPLASARGGRRSFTIAVPVDAVPGKTKLRINTGSGSLLNVIVPDGASAGDVLKLSDDERGNWSCQLVHGPKPLQTNEQSCACDVDAHNDKEKADGRAERMIVVVPGGITPGKSQLKVRTKLGGSVVLTIPENARIGDKLEITRSSDGHLDVCVSDALRPIRVRIDAEDAFLRLVTAVRAAGAQVSSKIMRGRAPPLNILGLLAKERIEMGEELVRMPAKLMFSPPQCKQMMPELYSKVFEIPEIHESRREEIATTSCLTKLLSRVKKMIDDDCEMEPQTVNADDVFKIWELNARVLLAECFDDHPYWHALQHLGELIALVQPSEEAHEVTVLASDAVAMHHLIQTSVSQELLGPAFDASIFVHAQLCGVTRKFDTHYGHSLLPVTDNFNHSVTPGCCYRWDLDKDEHVMTAMRAHEIGEELLTNYGSRSNALLFRTYGFTLPPDEEPAWTFSVPHRTSSKPVDLYEKYLHPACAKMPIQLDTSNLNGTIEILNKCVEHGTDPVNFLRELCERFIARYVADPDLQPAIDAMKRARHVDPTNADWWSELQPAPQEDVYRTVALRVKMGEYLCLVAHLEALDAATDRLPEESCLASAADLRAILRQALPALQRGQVVSLNYD